MRRGSAGLSRQPAACAAPSVFGLNLRVVMLPLASAATAERPGIASFGHGSTRRGFRQA